MNFVDVKQHYLLNLYIINQQRCFGKPMPGVTQKIWRTKFEQTTRRYQRVVPWGEMQMAWNGTPLPACGSCFRTMLMDCKKNIHFC